MSDSSSSPVSVGEIVDGKYRVERFLGAGGMGVVVLATHLAIENQVALKFLRIASGPAGDDAARFLREARAIGKLASEHIVRVYDAGKLADGTPYIVMEYVEGVDLGVLLASAASISVPDAVEYVLQAATALIESHKAAIVHRDLKPQNLLLGRRANGTALIKLLDFGIAKAIGGAPLQVLTDSCVVLGSPLYMSPEQMRGAPLDARSDLWSLGVILYQLLTRELPFDGQTVPELCLRVMTEGPPDLAQIAPHVPPAVVSVVSRCLEKDLERRIASAAELAAGLEPYSRSAERGVVDRPWRSLEATQESIGAPANGPAVVIVQPQAMIAETGVTWGTASKSRPEQPSHAGMPWGRSRFVALGSGIAGLVMALAFLWRRDNLPLSGRISVPAPVTAIERVRAARSEAPLAANFASEHAPKVPERRAREAVDGAKPQRIAPATKSPSNNPQPAPGAASEGAGGQTSPNPTPRASVAATARGANGSPILLP